MKWDVVNTIVSIIQIIVSVVLILSVIMQSAKKEGMAGIVGGASETFFGKNKGRTLDSKFALVTTICAIVFLISSMFLSYGMIKVGKEADASVNPSVETVSPDSVDLTTETETPAE